MCAHSTPGPWKLYQKKKNDEAVDLITKMLSNPDFRARPPRLLQATLALTIKYFDLVGRRLGTPEEKKARDDIVAKVTGLAKAIVNNRDWTAKEQADSARIILVRLALAKSSDDEEAAKKEGKKDDVAKLLADAKARVAEADEIFKGINIAVTRIPQGAHRAGLPALVPLQHSEARLEQKKQRRPRPRHAPASPVRRRQGPGHGTVHAEGS